MRRIAHPLAVALAALVSFPACSDRAADRASGAAPGSAGATEVALLNISFDATRELYDDVNAAFVKKWRADTGQCVTVRQSHGASGKQARAVLDGLAADVVTLGLSGDVDALAQKGQLLSTDWQKRLPHNSSPFASTIVFVVRAGNPKGIAGWDDLVKDGVVVITPNPKTSGAARLAYLAAWDHARQKAGSDDDAKAFVGKLYQHVPVLDTGARAATTTFAERGLGDVLLSWESDALFLLAHHPRTSSDPGFALVMPATSIAADLPVAVVDENVDKHGTRAVAEAYVQFLYSDEAQEIGARHHYRVRSPEVAARHPLPAIALRSVSDIAGSWSQAQKRHFDDGGVFDSVFTNQ